jgi:hypothetical protein
MCREDWVLSKAIGKVRELKPVGGKVVGRNQGREKVE